MRADEAADVVSFQLGILKLLGLVAMAPASGVWRAAGHVWAVLGALFLLGALANLGLLAGFVAYTFVEVRHAIHMSPFVLVLSLLPPLAFTVRALSVLLRTAHERRMMGEIVAATDEVLRLSFAEESLTSRLGEWKRSAITLGIVTLVLRVMWDACNWWYFVEQLETRPEATADHVWHPLPIPVTLLQFIVIWSVFSSLPFFVSQQVFGVAMVLSWMFGSCVKQLVAEINEAHADLARRLGRSVEHAARHMATAEATVVALKDRHARLVEYCEEFNDTFAWHLFFIYFLDVCAVCGYVADVVMNVESHLMSGKLYHWASLLLYGCYASLFFSPMVRVHEQGHLIMRALYQLLHTAEHYTPPTEGEHLKKYLVSFINASKDQVLMFHGADMFHITRHIPIATWTLALSAGIVCSEILGHQRKCPDCQSGNATANHTLSALDHHATTHNPALDFAL